MFSVQTFLGQYKGLIYVYSIMFLLRLFNTMGVGIRKLKSFGTVVLKMRQLIEQLRPTIVVLFTYTVAGALSLEANLMLNTFYMRLL